MMKKILFIFAILCTTLHLQAQTFNGIDVSHHQGNINWKQVAQNKNIQFVYIKATEGATFQDPKYKQNIKAARKAGLKVGAYHFFSMTSSAQAQFANIKNTIGKDIDLLPMIDLEVSRKKYKLADIRKRVNELLALVEAYYGVKPMLYVTQDRYYIICDDSRSLYEPYKVLKRYQDYLLYFGQIGRHKPTFVDNHRYCIWQYSETGKLTGIQTGVDLCRFHPNHSILDIVYLHEK